MKKSVKKKSASVKKEAGPDMMGLITRMLEQLIVLERKIDSLSARPFQGPDARHNAQRPPEGKQGIISRERILHKAICADCSKECEVPFKPSGDRPVYCKECYSKRRNGHSRELKEKSSRASDNRVVIYERRFQKDEGANAPKPVEKKKAHAGRRK